MSEKNPGHVKRSKEWAGNMVDGARNGSGVGKCWFVVMSILSFAFSIIIPLGCMSPPTRYFTFFAVDTQVLAHRYNTPGANTPFAANSTSAANNTLAANSTGKTLYNDDSLSRDLAVLPEIYRFGMSGVCREFSNSDEILCTKKFPQELDLGPIIENDILGANMTNSTASHLLAFWDGFFQSDKILQNAERRMTFTRVSAGLAVTSLVIAPIGFAVTLLLYMLNRASYKTVATIYALLDAALVVLAAVLWIYASIQYAQDIESNIVSRGATQSWNKLPQYPASFTYGVIMLAAVAIAKVIVLPILAVMCFFFLVAMVILAFLVIILAIMALSCILSAVGRRRAVVYY